MMSNRKARDYFLSNPCRALLLVLLLSSYSANVMAKAPWLKTIGAQQRVADIHTVATVANVSVSDGLTYSTSTVFHDHQRAIFQRKYASHTITHGVEGKYIWAYDGKAETQAPAMMADFVLGHQIHAQILFFDRLNQPNESGKTSEFAGKSASALVSKDSEKTWTFYYGSDHQPLGMELAIKGQKPIVFQFSNWQLVDGISLPFSVSIDDGSRQFQYKYDTIKLNQGTLATFRAPESQITEEQRLLRLHRMIMDDHLFGQTDKMKSFTGEQVAIVSGGEVYQMPGKQSDEHMARIMGNRNYTVYDDLIRPVVTISDDGTLGWVIVQVSAKGVRLDPQGKPTVDLAFVSGWIELYQKVKNQWRMVGNVSNFK